MPNNCRNTITIKGDSELIQTIVNTKFSFDVLNPVGDVSNERCVELWGTKWDCWNFELLKRSKDTIVFECITAWNPPTKIIDMLIQSCDAWVKCEWHEEGGLAGIIVGDKSEVKELMWEDMCLEALSELS